MNRSAIHDRAILRFLDHLETRDITMHGFHMQQGGRLLAEGYWQPFAAHIPHRMYSVGKSLTSLAIGMLQGDGQLSLADPIATYFPDKLPPDPPAPILRATIRDLLRMASPHSATTYRPQADTDWVRTFFTTPPTNEPGMVFAYDTSASHVLSALVERLSGQRLLDFLTRRLFRPLGCDGEIRWLPDPMGVCQGGSGLIMTLPDLVRVAACCLRGGDGLAPRAYLDEATSHQIDTFLQPRREEGFGYGYQFWRTRHDGYVMYGMGGQLAVCLPPHDFILCTTADTRLDPSGVETIYDALWTHMLPSLENPATPDAAITDALMRRLGGLSVKPVTSILADSPSRETYTFAENPLGLQEIQLCSNALAYVNHTGSHSIPYADGQWAHSTFPGTGEPCMASGGFTRTGVFRLRVHLTGDTLGGVDLQLAFTGSHVTVQARHIEDTVFAGWTGVASGHIKV